MAEETVSIQQRPTEIIKAIQALKSGAIDSGVNLQTGLKHRATDSGDDSHTGTQDNTPESSQPHSVKKPMVADSDAEEFEDEDEQGKHDTLQSPCLRWPVLFWKWPSSPG